jgi:hypothetical protein
MTKKEECVKEFCKELSNLEGFRYTYKKMLYFVEQSKFLEKKQKPVDENTPYKIFVRKQIDDGVELGKIFELWDKTKVKVK